MSKRKFEPGLVQPDLRGGLLPQRVIVSDAAPREVLIC
jgi:hypothetical protein